MSFDEFKDRARDTIQQLQPLTQPITELDSGHWTRDVSLQESTQQELRGLGTVELRGSVGAELHLTRRDEPPEDLDSFAAAPEPTDNAIASVVVEGQAGAELQYQQPLATGAGITITAGAAAELALAQHRRVPATETGLSALEDLIGNVRNPFDIDSLLALDDHELFQIQFAGNGFLSATAGWEWGIVRSFEGTKVENLAPDGDLGGFRASFKAGATVRVSAEGEFRVRVDRSPRDPQQVRVRLHKKSSNFFGAGISIRAEAKLTQPNLFVDSVLDRLLRLPDGFVDRIVELRGELTELQNELSGLAQELRDEIAAAAGVAEEALGLDDLERLRENAGQLPANLTAPLAPLFELLERIQAAIDDGESQLIEFVDKTLSRVNDPLENLSSKLEEWINAYRDARQRVVTFLEERAREGIQAEYTAGLNRSKTSEALLELDFVPEETGIFLIEAMKGNFGPALERATTPGATGVEIISGFLKETSKRDRFYNLRFNLFSFSTAIDFQRWTQVDVITDARTGEMTISGEAAASLAAETNRRSNELRFLFDVYGAFEQRDDTFLTTAETNFRAVLSRSAEFHGIPKFRSLIPHHVEGARRLKLLDEERKQDLVAALRGNNSPNYNYELQLSVPPTAIRRMFSLDLDESTSSLRDRLWGWMREAVDIIYYPVPGQSSIEPLSYFFAPEVIETVNSVPSIAQQWTSIRNFRDPNGERFQDGAYKMVWAYLLNARRFVEGYLKTRDSLEEGRPLQQTLDSLSNLAGRVVAPVGAFSTRPFDAKYLVLVLAEGFKEIEIQMRFQRGSVDVLI